MQRRKVPKKHQPLSSGVLYHPEKVHYDELVRTAQDISDRLAVNRAARVRSDNAQLVRRLPAGAIPPEELAALDEAAPGRRETEAHLRWLEAGAAGPDPCESSG